MTGAFKKEKVAFDRDRVMPAWDGLVSRQQQELERMKVPIMYPTSVPQDRQVWNLHLSCFIKSDFATAAAAGYASIGNRCRSKTHSILKSCNISGCTVLPGSERCFTYSYNYFDFDLLMHSIHNQKHEKLTPFVDLALATYCSEQIQHKGPNRQASGRA